jgi:uncharacterized protein (TIGR03083 family)
MTDWGTLYRDHVDAVAALARSLSDDELATTVPASPAWTVRDVLGHLAGVADDSLTGRTDGAPGPEWTGRQVAERAALPVSDVVAELESHVDAMAAAADGAERPAMVWDIATHHADLHEALGRPRLPERLWLPVAEAVRPRAGALAEAAPPYEVFRAVFSRRSRDQLRAWGSPMSDDELDAVCIFGPRLDDQPQPVGEA